jgi:hypothetical protein
MTRAHSAVAQCRQARIGLVGALLLLLSPAAWAGTSNQQNPVVTFNLPGTKQVTLQVCNVAGCNTVTKAVTVRDPTPAVTAASFSPQFPEAGQLVLLTGTGTGKPPLGFTWQPAPILGSPLPSLQGSTVWWDTAGLPAGAYTVSFRTQNGSGTAVQQLPITLAPAAILDFYTVTPCRIYDSRQGTAIASGAARSIQGIGGACGVPVGARALAANVTVIAPSGPGFATFYPGNYPQPVASTVTFSAGDTRSNNTVLPLATDGGGNVTALLSVAGNGSAHVVVDVSGYFMP